MKNIGLEIRNSASLNPFSPFISGWSNRLLIVRLAKREIESRYRGSLLGLAWSVLVPLILLLVYTFVFTVVFQTKWGVSTSGNTPFTLILFCGLIVFNMFSECLTRAPTLMLSNISYIKKVVFPLEILPWVMIVVALFNAGVCYFILSVGYAFLIGIPPITSLLLPLIILPSVLLALGLTLFFASVGVFVRDLQQIIGLLIMVLMFLSPLFYPLSSLPASMRGYIKFSPIAIAIEESRNVLFAGVLPDFFLLGVYFFISWFVTWLGFVWFMKTKKGFADVV